MIFADLAAGTAPFLDANVFIDHFTAHPRFGTACTDLLRRIERQEPSGFTSAHVLSEVAHRLMTIEASQRFGWPFPGIAYRLSRQPAQVQQLTEFRRALQEIDRFGIPILTIPPILLDTGAGISQQTGLLSNDALIVAVMQSHGLSHLASRDSDFDRVPGLTRSAPA